MVFLVNTRSHTSCSELVWHFNGLVTPCGYFHLCPDHARLSASLLAHLSASRTRSLTASILRRNAR